jgi:uncharacterized protein YndB with AHSA1/START domain
MSSKRVACKRHTDCYNVSIEVTPKAIEPNRRIVIDWPGYSGPTTVEWTFDAHKDDTTFVRVCDGVHRYGRAAGQVRGGFDARIYIDAGRGSRRFLKHGVRLNLVRDRYPKGVDPSVS